MAQKIENFDGDNTEPVNSQNDDNVTTPTAADAAATPKRNWIKPVGIAAGSVLLLGLTFGAGAAAANFVGPHPSEFGIAHVEGMTGTDGHGEIRGDERGEHGDGGRGGHGPEGQAGLGELQGGMTADPNDLCHPGDGHTHDASGADVTLPDGTSCVVVGTTGTADVTTDSTTTTP